MILAGEIGPESAHLALFESPGGALRLVRSACVAPGDYPALRPILRRFTAEDLTRLRAACVAVPGPVVEDRFSGGGLPWPMAARDVARALGLAAAEIIGPGLALAEAVAGLPVAELLHLRPPRAAAGDRLPPAPGQGAAEVALAVGEGMEAAAIRPPDDPAGAVLLPLAPRRPFDGAAADLRDVADAITLLARRRPGLRGLCLGGPWLESTLAAQGGDSLARVFTAELRAREEACPELRQVVLYAAPGSTGLMGAARRGARSSRRRPR